MIDFSGTELNPAAPLHDCESCLLAQITALVGANCSDATLKIACSRANSSAGVKPVGQCNVAASGLCPRSANTTTQQHVRPKAHGGGGGGGGYVAPDVAAGAADGTGLAGTSWGVSGAGTSSHSCMGCVLGWARELTIGWGCTADQLRGYCDA